MGLWTLCEWCCKRLFMMLDMPIILYLFLFVSPNRKKLRTIQLEWKQCALDIAREEKKNAYAHGTNINVMSLWTEKIRRSNRCNSKPKIERVRILQNDCRYASLRYESLPYHIFYFPPNIWFIILFQFSFFFPIESNVQA